MLQNILFLLLSAGISLGNSQHFSHKSSNSSSLPLVRRNSSETLLRNIEDVYYEATLYIGTPAKAFPVIIDTGSADLFVMSAENTYCEQQNSLISQETRSNVSAYALFDCENSSSCVQTSQTITLSYDDGEVLAEIVWDRVRISQELSVQNQSFLLATQIIGNFDCIGLLGLGFPSLAKNKNPVFIESLYETGQISQYLFGLYLTSEDSAETSRLIIGEIDYSLIQAGENLTYFPFVSTNSYEISIDSLMLNGTSIDLGPVGTALPDSGNSEITLPRKIAEEIVEFLNEAAKMQCFLEVELSATDYSMLVCEIFENSTKFPDISIGLQGKTIVLQPEDYVDECFFAENGALLCSTDLESSEIDGEIILGDAFLQSFYSVFDLENEKLGLARNKKENSIKLTANSSVLLSVSVSTAGKTFDWKVYWILMGLLLLLPVIYISGEVMNRRKIISENQNSVILGVGFLVVIISINAFISVI